MQSDIPIASERRMRFHHTRSSLLAVVLFATQAIGALAPLRVASGQETLAEALAEADRFAYPNRMAEAAARAAEAGTLAPLRGVLPSVRIEAGYLRTTDPIGVFGSTLRQRAITQANFAPDRLNYPSAVGNYQGGVVVEQPIFNADAWAGRRAAGQSADASRSQADWTRLSTRADVVRAWYGTVLAAERVATLADASRAAQAHVAQAEAMLRQGLVTKSDVLLAAVRAGELDAQLVEAEGAAENARRQLSVALGGQPARASVDLPRAERRMPDADRIRTLVASDTADVAAQRRADVAAAEHGVGAARADALRARGSYLPRINSFARYDWNSPDALYAGDENWTVGIVASWSLFAGAGDLADVRATTGREAGTRAALAAAEAGALLEVEQTRTALIVALARLTIAERAVRQSAEAHRIVEKKYAGGLATVVELLDAQAVETSTALGLSAARYAAIGAAADRRRALGRDPGSLAALEADTGVAEHRTPDDNTDRTARPPRDAQD